MEVVLIRGTWSAVFCAAEEFRVALTVMQHLEPLLANCVKGAGAASLLQDRRARTRQWAGRGGEISEGTESVSTSPRRRR